MNEELRNRILHRTYPLSAKTLFRAENTVLLPPDEPTSALFHRLHIQEPHARRFYAGKLLNDRQVNTIIATYELYNVKPTKMPFNSISILEKVVYLMPHFMWRAAGTHVFDNIEWQIQERDPPIFVNFINYSHKYDQDMRDFLVQFSILMQRHFDYIHVKHTVNRVEHTNRAVVALLFTKCAEAVEFASEQQTQDSDLPIIQQGNECKSDSN
jgi:hypothetical protein